MNGRYHRHTNVYTNCFVVALNLQFSASSQLKPVAFVTLHCALVNLSVYVYLVVGLVVTPCGDPLGGF